MTRKCIHWVITSHLPLNNRKTGGTCCLPLGKSSTRPGIPPQEALRSSCQGSQIRATWLIYCVLWTWSFLSKIFAASGQILRPSSHVKGVTVFKSLGPRCASSRSGTPSSNTNGEEYSVSDGSYLHVQHSCIMPRRAFHSWKQDRGRLQTYVYRAPHREQWGPPLS